MPAVGYQVMSVARRADTMVIIAKGPRRTL